MLTRKHILYGILVLLGLFADAYDVSAKPVSDGREINLVIVNGDSLSVEPGRIFTVVYKLTNDESDDRNLQPRMTLPDGWKLASALTPIHVSGGGSTVRFITFRIPTSARAEAYTTTFSVEDATNRERVASISSVIRVRAVYGLELSVDPLPEFVPSGRRLNTILSVRNMGNSTVTVRLEATGSPDLYPLLDESMLTMAPGELISVDASIPTDSRIDNKVVQQAYFRAYVQDHPAILESVTASVNVIPVYSRVKPRAANVPLNIAFQTTGDENGRMGQIGVSGVIDALGGKISVDMMLSRQRTTPMFGSRDAYRLTYSSSNITVKLGDHVQALSPLTTRGEYGAGASTEIRNGKMSYRGLIQRTRHIFPTQGLIGASVALQTNSSTRLSTNILHRSGIYRGTLATARLQVRPLGPQHQVDIECGLDSSSGFSEPSCQAEFTGATSKIGYQGLYRNTSDTYPGSISSLTERAATVSWSALPGVRMDGTFRQQERGFGPGFGRLSKYYRVGMGFNNRYGRTTFFGDVHAIRQDQRHSSETFAVDRSENILRITGGFQLLRMSLRVLADVGSAKSIANGYSGSFYRRRATLRTEILRGVSISATGEFSDGYLINAPKRMKRWLYSSSLNVRLQSHTRFNATIYRNVAHTFSRLGYTSYQAFVQHTFKSGHKLTIQAQQSRLDGASLPPSTDYRFAYSIPLGLPIGPRGKAGRYVEGRVFESNTDAGIGGVLVFLDEHAAITDTDGFFKIPRDIDRTQYLRIDQRSIGYDRVPVLKMPYQISNESSSSRLDIPIVNAASIIGTVTLEGSPDNSLLLGAGQNPIMHKISALRDVVIELANSTHRHRTRTDRSGRYKIKNVTPGEYSLRIVAARLPEYYTFETESVKVILKADTSLVRDFNAIQVVRNIKMLTNKTTSTVLSSGGEQPIRRSNPKPHPTIHGSSAPTEPPSTRSESRDGSVLPPVPPERNTLIPSGPRPSHPDDWYELLEKSQIAPERDTSLSVNVADSYLRRASVVPAGVNSARVSLTESSRSHAEAGAQTLFWILIAIGIWCAALVLLFGPAGLRSIRRSGRIITSGQSLPRVLRWPFIIRASTGPVEATAPLHATSSIAPGEREDSNDSTIRRAA